MQFRVYVMKLEVCQECFVFLSRVYIMTFEECRVYVMKFKVCQQGFVLFSSDLGTPCLCNEVCGMS